MHFDLCNCTFQLEILFAKCYSIKKINIIMKTLKLYAPLHVLHFNLKFYVLVKFIIVNKSVQKLNLTNNC